jgi:hypothetical protein
LTTKKLGCLALYEPRRDLGLLIGKAGQ